MQANSEAEFFRLFGGGWELWFGGKCMGVFPSKKAAQRFLKEEA